MKLDENKSNVIQFKDLNPKLFFIFKGSEVESLNNAYGKNFNYYFINPFTIETYGSWGMFPESAVVKVGE